MPALGTTAFPTAGNIFSLVRSLLNDADLVATSTITPTGATRASNVVTITTSAAHGLAIGNVVTIGSISDTSFNGTQTVTATPTATTFQYNQTAANATSGNGVVQLAIQGDIFTDNVLLPLANKAYRKVQARLQSNGSKSMTSEAFLTLTANQTQLLDTTSPQLPVDFLAPRDLSERISGSNLAYVPMGQVNIIPSFPSNVPLATNGIFAWFEDGIYLPGATNAMDIRLRYFVAFPDVSSASGSFTIRGCEDVVATHTAYLAANSRGAANASMFLGMFNEDMTELLNLQAHARNYLVGRRRPNNAGRGSSRFWGTGRVL